MTTRLSGLNTSILTRPVPLCSCHTHLLSDYALQLGQYRRPGMLIQLRANQPVLHRLGCLCFGGSSPPTFEEFAHHGVRVLLLSLSDARVLAGTRPRGRYGTSNTYRWSRACCRELAEA